MTRGADGVWQVTLANLDPGAYRYRFSVDAVPTADPSNPSVSQSNSNAWSLFEVPGAAFKRVERRSYLDQLARIPFHVRAAALSPMTRRTRPFRIPAVGRLTDGRRVHRSELGDV
jgi:hypothetical protein